MKLLGSLYSSPLGATEVFRGATECGSGLTKGSDYPVATVVPGGGPTLHMYPDRDAPGERLFLQLQEVLPGLVHHQLPQGCKDYSEYYLKMKTPLPFGPSVATEEVAPLGGAAVTSSHCSKDPSRPLGGIINSKCVNSKFKILPPGHSP